MVKIGITGSNGFIGKNLIEQLIQHKDIAHIRKFERERYSIEGNDYLNSFVAELDILYHLGGVNRPKEPSEFTEGNTAFTHAIVGSLIKTKQKTTLIYTSSMQAVNPSGDYGISKQAAENAIQHYTEITSNNAYIYQLPNIFGKWCKPFYNSAVATFCHQVVSNQSLTIHNRNSQINLLYVGHVVEILEQHIIDNPNNLDEEHYKTITSFSTTKITVGELADKLIAFKEKQDLNIENWNDFDRELYATFLSYLQ